MKVSEIKEILKEHNLKATENRIAVLSCLADNDHFHSVNDIVDHTAKKLNVKSVYNTISVLLEHGVIQSVSFNGEQKYVFEDQNKTGNKSVHIFDRKSNEAKHVSINDKIFKDIADETKLKENEIKSIKIIVEK